MSLNNTTADVTGAAINSAVQALTTEQKSDPETCWKTIMRVIYAHLVTDAVVVVASVSGVTTGPGTSGPGTGTLT